MWLEMWLYYSKITHAVPVKPLAYLTETISAGVNNENGLNLKWLVRPYFIAYGMSTQLGSGGSFWHVVDAQQHEQTNTSIIMRSWVSGESFPLTESHLSICSNCFHISCRFCMYTYAKSKSVPDVALQEQCTLS